MFEIAEDEFAIPFFKEEGFTRRKCAKCGSHFWSKNLEQQTCGETPCEPYTFIGNPPTKRRLDLREMRIQFLDYFAQQGHARIKPYPIVARWRDDVYLVGASIFDFQPYVTEGVMPPPANPLVVSQPCIRFTDIDHVGPTGGRHMTIFEMGGAHAFNHPDRDIYWKDETVRYHHKLLVDVMGVQGDAVTYKEHFWSGGGNAGPDLEGIVGGLEISTLVFMMYKVEGNRLTPTRIRTVDTGYGIERWSWLSQGSASGFHAIYGPLLKQVMELAKLDVSEETASAATKASGMFYSSNSSWRGPAIDWIAQETRLDIGHVGDSIGSLESAYGLVDHTKSVCFLLADGVVSSNVGEGYLARLIIRRAVRLARQLGISDMLPDLMEMQIKHWGSDFRTLREMRDEIMEGFRAETKKYQDTLSRGSETVARLSRDLASKGIRKISPDQLVELYDSQGLSPEIVKEGAEKVGVEVDIPDNFLSLVAGRHSKPSEETKVASPGDFQGKLKDIPPTRSLYYDTPYLTSFSGKVAANPTANSVVLDQTCFYPQGGGQPGDHGELRFGETTAKVVDVQKFDGAIVHFLDRSVPEGSELAEGTIDWTRRQSLMRHHTSTHALLGAARKVLGDHVWQAGAQKDVETSRLDITHYGEINDRERERIERLVNQLILKNVPVQTAWFAREKAEAKYGFRLYQGGPVPGPKVRVVRIPGWDVEACGGTHCKRTGELGVFKIVKVDRLQDGVERIVFAAGESALRQISKQAEILSKTSEILGTPPDRVYEAVRTLVNERDSMEKELKKLREKALDSQAKNLSKKAKNIGPVRAVLAKTAKRKDINPLDLANKLRVTKPDIVAILVEVSDKVQIVAAAGDGAVSAGVNAGEIVSEVSRLVGGGGGGRAFFGTGGGPGKENVDAVIDRAVEIITRQVGIKMAEPVG